MRSQGDGKQNEYSRRGALDCSDSTDVARQEFKSEADVNVLLQKYGVGIPQKQVAFGDTNFDIDLQEALAAVQAAKRAYRQLPPELRQRYPSWQTLLNNLASGRITKADLDTPVTKPEVPAPSTTETKT